MKLSNASSGVHMQIHFDQQTQSDGFDYSPLPRLTWRSFLMGVLVSMGGLM